MSYARELLYSIADQLGRNRKDMDSYVSTLQKNWYDTKQSMRSLTMRDLEKFQFPGKLNQMILQRLESSSKHPPKHQKMQIENPLSDYLYGLKKMLSKEDFNEAISMLIRIFSNIRQRVTQQKYRLLKKSNEKISKLTSIPEVERILEYGGFDRSKQGYYMNKINLARIDQCIEQISKNVERAKFNPYQQQIISLGSTNVKNYEGQTSAVYNQKLQELQKQRERMMSKPIKDRQIKVFQIKPENIQRMEVQFNEKEQLNEDQKIYMQNVKEILKKSSEDPQFMNRRKKEYFDLLKQPCFTETTVRVKMPDNYVFECKFAPMQPLQSLVDVFHEHLQHKNINYYLYMTPPVQQLKGLLLRKTFYELGCVPKAIFYFKSDQQIKGNIMKAKKGGFFGGIFS